MLAAIDHIRKSWLALRVTIRRCLQLLSNAKVPNNKLVDFEPPESSATDRQATNSKGADGQRSNRDGGKRQRANRLCPDADRWKVGEPSFGVGSMVIGDACIAFRRRHQWHSTVGLTPA